MEGQQKFATLLMLLHVVLASDLPDITYEEIERLNASCYFMDNCLHPRDSDDLSQYNCNCGEFCTQVSTCCIDSKYRSAHPVPQDAIRCNFAGSYVWMRDTCSKDWHGDTSVAQLCSSNGKDRDDPFLAIPVTNMIDGITYKNYFCAVCNHNMDQLKIWNIQLRSTSVEVLDSEVPELHYNSDIDQWTTRNGTNVFLSVEVPGDLADRVHTCVPGIISECSPHWIDTSVAINCKLYMAIARFTKGNDISVYRNPHCAICNFEDLDNMTCADERFQLKTKLTAQSATTKFFVGLFSLHDKMKNCEENMVYDVIAKKCRATFKG